LLIAEVLMSFVSACVPMGGFSAASGDYPHFRDQVDWLSVPETGLCMDYIGKYESLERDFQHVCGVLEVQATLGHVGGAQADRADWRSEYSRDSAQFVGELYQRDIEHFDYAFDGD
jgi:hypothetical protein